jgi:hypothetical protein
MTEEQAIDIVESAYARLRSQWPEAEPILVMRDQTRRIGSGYVFRVSTKTHVVTGDKAYAAYVGPVVVDTRKGEVVELPTHVDVEQALKRYEDGSLTGTVLERFKVGVSGA